jgi:cullin-associated NEDD8-dissociated protein 1
VSVARVVALFFVVLTSAHSSVVVHFSRVVTAVLEFYPSIGSTAQTQLHSALIDHALEPSLVMATSSLLRDQALESLLSFFRQLVDKKIMTFQELFAALDARLGAKTSKGGVYNLSKSMSAVITSAAESEQNKTLDDIFARLGGSETPTKGLELRRVQLAVLMTGDLGRSIELGQKGQAADKLKAIYEGYFASSSEDLRSAVAYALGNASVGSPSAFLPMIVSRLGDENKRLQFLLLSALREFIQFNATAGNDMTAQMATLVPPLEEHCSDKEEGVRSLVAECLGSLAVAHPDAVLPKLAELQKSHGIIAVTNGAIDESDDASMKNSNIFSTIATSVKHAIAGQVDQSQLAPFMPTFAELIQQEDLRVRNAALLMLYSAFHHMPNVVSQMATKESIMPFLYKVAELKAERKVDLGPFTHTVDDALPLRKSALSIFATCLETNPDVLDIPSLMAVLARSLGDKEDIQLHAHQIIMSMVSHHSYHLSASLNSFVEPLEKTMNKKAGNKTGTELERFNDLIKSSLRVMITLGAMEGANGSTKFMDLVQRVKGNSKFVSQIEAIESES